MPRSYLAAVFSAFALPALCFFGCSSQRMHAVLFRETGEDKLNFLSTKRSMPERGEPMKRSFLVLLPLMALTMSLYGQADPTIEQLLTESEKKFEDFDKVVKNAKQHDGLFHL